MNTWPELNLPEAEAKAFWLENSVHLFISEPPADPLPEGYTISLVIANDSGGGNYYVSKGELK